MTARDKSPRVYFFGDPAGDREPPGRDVLGGKGASLAAMSRAGLPVPPGFVISAECCRMFLEAGGQWPAGLQQEVRENLARLEQVAGSANRFGDAESPLLVAVRSGATLSMPGMMDTILNCGLTTAMAVGHRDPQAFWRVYTQFVAAFAGNRAAIPAGQFEAIERRFASRPGRPPGALSAGELRELAQAYVRVYTDRTGRAFPDDPWQCLTECIETVFNSWNSRRAIAYRASLPPRQVHGLVGTAVTVQAMFPSQVSGVAFTRNPNDPAADEIIVESSWGLGQAVVSGDVHPDHFVVDRASFALKRVAIGRKTRVVTALPARGPQSPQTAIGGPRPAHATPEGRIEGGRDRDAPSLAEGEIRRLAQMAVNVERLLGAPADIEWGLAEGEFVLLQARPITALGQAEVRQQLLGETRSRLRELAAAGRGPWVLHNLAETLPHPTPLTWSVIRRFMSGAGGFGAMYRMAGFQPSEAVCRDGFLERIAGKVYMDVSLAPEMFFEDYPFRYDPVLLRGDPDAVQSPPTAPAGSIASRVRAARRLAVVNRRLRRQAGDLDKTLAERTLPAFAAWCRRERQRDLATLSPEQVCELWRDREGRVMDQFAAESLLPSLIGGVALADLRAFLAENFWDEDTDELANTLAAPQSPDKTMSANAELFAVAQGRRELSQWLAEHGHRGPEEFDLASPRWREQPDELRALAGRLTDGADPLGLHRARVARTEAHLELLRSRLARRDREELDRRVALARRYMIFREDGKYYLMLGYELLRDLAIEAGRRLALGDDVFLLTCDELLEALRAGAVPGDLIGQRKAAYLAETRLVLPRMIDASTIDSLGRPAKGRSAESHIAFPVSAGLSAGPVRVVRSPQDAGELGHGYILVCSSTDPAWAPLFVNAAGLVLECGGTLSHGAVIAREMGIPAVVLPGATTLFRDGELVHVDGSAGTVSRSAGPAETRAAEEPQPTNAHVPARQAPPPPGRRERFAAKLRNVFLLLWGVYLSAAFLLPEAWLYRPSMAVLDWLLWPMVVALGKPAAVAVVAAALASLTMIGQRLLTDNARIREARRRANRLARRAARLPADSPRRSAMRRLAAPVNLRVLSAALVPLAVLLGPMVMTFVWLPARVDPASWNAPAGTDVSVVARVDSEFRGPVTLSVAHPLVLDESSPPSRTLPPIRETLERLLARWQGGGHSVGTQADGPGVGVPARDVQGLRSYLDAGVPPQGVMWKVRAPQDAAGRFPITVVAGRGPPAALNVVLGERFPPGPAEALGGPRSPIRSVRIVYPRPERKRVFWAPLDRLSSPGWLPGWLVVYLVVYLPVMFLFRRVLRVA